MSRLGGPSRTQQPSDDLPRWVPSRNGPAPVDHTRHEEEVLARHSAPQTGRRLTHWPKLRTVRRKLCRMTSGGLSLRSSWRSSSTMQSLGPVLQGGHARQSSPRATPGSPPPGGLRLAVLLGGLCLSKASREAEGMHSLPRWVWECHQLAESSYSVLG